MYSNLSKIFIQNSTNLGIRKPLLLLLSTLFIICGFTRVENSKAVIAKNKVKSVVKSTCNGGCSGQYTEYDKRGNEIEFNFYRTGTIYRYFYNDQDSMTMYLWIDKYDKTQIDTFYPNETRFGETKAIYDEEYSADRKLLKKFWGETRIEIYYDEQENEIKRLNFKRDTLTEITAMQYDEESRLIEKISKNVSPFKNAYFQRTRDGEKIETFTTRYKYNAKGQVIELYTYFTDPCMGLDNHYLYVYHYHENGLLESAEVYEEGDKMAFSLEYDYEFY